MKYLQRNEIKPKRKYTKRKKASTEEAGEPKPKRKYTKRVKK